MASNIPSEIKKVRRDISDRLWHFTRRDGKSLQTLETILTTERIVGGTDKYCAERSVCFTEMPLLEAIRQSPTLDMHSYGRLSDYGIGFKKDWVFGKGGRPVIYGLASEKHKLPTDMRWRHCDLDLAMGIDFTWQREWRVPVAELAFDASQDPLVVVRTMEEAYDLLCTDYCEDPVRDEVYFTLTWSFISHEQLQEAKTSDDVEVLSWERG